MKNEAQEETEALARCDQCRHMNRFGNCLMPQEAGLTGIAVAATPDDERNYELEGAG
jgi:hypothetical protein